MRLSPVATVGALLSLALILTACGNEGASPAGGPQGSTLKAAPAGAKAASGQCRSQLRPVLELMDGLREDLAVGLNYDEYLRQLNGVRGAYGDIRDGRLRLDCLTAAGAPAERALNRYGKAANIWGDCLAAVACEIGPIEPKLRRLWARASALLSSAQSGL